MTPRATEDYEHSVLGLVVSLCSIMGEGGTGKGPSVMTVSKPSTVPRALQTP